MNRTQAIHKAVIYRNGTMTIDEFGCETTHESISAAKRYVRKCTDGKTNICVVQRKGENLFLLRHQRIAEEKARKEAEEAAKKAAEEAAKAIEDALQAEHEARKDEKDYSDE